MRPSPSFRLGFPSMYWRIDPPAAGAGLPPLAGPGGGGLRDIEQRGKLHMIYS